MTQICYITILRTLLRLTVRRDDFDITGEQTNPLVYRLISVSTSGQRQ